MLLKHVLVVDVISHSAATMAISCMEGIGRGTALGSYLFRPQILFLSSQGPLGIQLFSSDLRMNAKLPVQGGRFYPWSGNWRSRC